MTWMTGEVLGCDGDLGLHSPIKSDNTKPCFSPCVLNAEHIVDQFSSGPT
jgi:hypothetical protein